MNAKMMRERAEAADAVDTSEVELLPIGQQITDISATLVQLHATLSVLAQKWTGLMFSLAESELLNPESEPEPPAPAAIKEHGRPSPETMR